MCVRVCLCVFVSPFRNSPARSKLSLSRHHLLSGRNKWTSRWWTMKNPTLYPPSQSWTSVANSWGQAEVGWGAKGVADLYLPAGLHRLCLLSKSLITLPSAIQSLVSLGKSGSDNIKLTPISTLESFQMAPLWETLGKWGGRVHCCCTFSLSWCSWKWGDGGFFNFFFTIGSLFGNCIIKTGSNILSEVLPLWWYLLERPVPLSQSLVPFYSWEKRGPKRSHPQPKTS